jgi:hypothetical protein
MIEMTLTALLAEAAQAGPGNARAKRIVPLPQSIARPTLSGVAYAPPGSAVLPANTPVRTLSGDEQSDEKMEKHLEQALKQVTGQGQGMQGRRSLDGGELSNTAPGDPNTSPTSFRPPTQKNKSRSSVVESPGRQLSFSNPTNTISHSRSVEFMSVTSPNGGENDYQSAESEGDVMEMLMRATSQHRPGYSIKENAARRHKQLSSTNFRMTEKHVFYNSAILTPQEAQVTM